MPKIHSVLELANYKTGDLTWWVVLRPLIGKPSLSEEDKWMKKHHPKSLYSHGPYHKIWDYHAKNIQLPKLQHMDFKNVVNLLTSRFVIEEFVICDIIRSNKTGEFYYSNCKDEWIPEVYVMDSKTAARRELNRILRLMKDWIKKNEK